MVQREASPLFRLDRNGDEIFYLVLIIILLRSKIKQLIVIRRFMSIYYEGGISHRLDSLERKERFVARRMVVKIGGSTITEGGDPLNREFMADIARQVSELIKGGVRVVVVSSGAVACGRAILNERGLNQTILDDQVAAMVGQSRLMEEWNGVFRKFRKYGIDVGQVLVTDNDLGSLKTTIMRAFEIGVVPIINANDPVSAFEMKQYKISADNDRLAGEVVRIIDADTLVLLTDRDGVLDENGEVISWVDRLENIEEVINEEEGSGRGGMWSKAIQAHNAACEGRFSVIVNGREPDVLLKAARRENIGTRFVPPFMLY